MQISKLEPHAFSQYKDPFPLLELERKSLPEVRRDKKSLSPDEMPRLTPVNLLRSEKQVQDTEMVEMVTCNFKCLFLWGSEWYLIFAEFSVKYLMTNEARWWSWFILFFVCFASLLNVMIFNL